MEKRSRLVLSLIFAAGLWTFGTAHAQDTITNAAQFTAVFDQSGLSYPLISPFDGNFQPIDTWFVDFSAITNAFAAIANYDWEIHRGVTVWPLRLIQNAATGEVVVKPGTNDVELLRLDAPPDFVPYATYGETLRFWALFFGNGDTSYDALIADGDTFLDPPRVVMDVWVVSATDEDSYLSYSEPQGTVQFMLMSADDDSFGDVDPCNITNIFQPFSFTSIQIDSNRNTILAWQACTNFIYGVLSTDVLTTNTFWTWRSYLFGQPNSLSWTDTTTTATNIVNRFYKIARKLPVAISAGGLHSVALRPDGTVWAWGSDEDGQLGDQTYGDPYPFYYPPHGGDRPFPVEVADPTSCFGQTISNAVALAAGGQDFTVVVDAEGRVWTWGESYSDIYVGVLGDGGSRASLLDAEGNLLAPSRITGVSNVVSVATGHEHTLALRADGAVFAWGSDEWGQLGVGGPTTSCQCTNSPIQSLIPPQVVAIAAGDVHSVALDLNARVWVWGEGSSGQLGIGGTARTNTPTMVTNIANVVAISAGGFHTVALTSDQTVWTWGDSGGPALGRGGDYTVPGPVSGLSNVVGIAGGNGFTLAVTGNGRVYAWGNNSNGQLGTNGISLTNAPMLVAGISNAVLVSAHSPDDDDSGHLFGGWHSLRGDSGPRELSLLGMGSQ